MTKTQQIIHCFELVTLRIESVNKVATYTGWRAALIHSHDVNDMLILCSLISMLICGYKNFGIFHRMFGISINGSKAHLI